VKLKWAIVVVALCVVVTVAAVAYAAGKATDVPEVIRAQRFELVDPEGEVRAFLGLHEGGSPSLTLVSTRPRLSTAAVTINDEGEPALFLLNGRAATSADLSLNNDGSAGMSVSDKLVRVRVYLGTLPGGDPSLHFRDDQKQPRYVVYLIDGKEPYMELLDAKGSTVWSAP
jgi:hypothetical protein